MTNGEGAPGGRTKAQPKPAGMRASERSEQRARCGVAAPTSKSPEPPREPKPAAHRRAPVGHRWQPASNPFHSAARRHSWISISPGQEMPPRYQPRVQIVEGPAAPGCLPRVGKENDPQMGADKRTI